MPGQCAQRRQHIGAAGLGRQCLGHRQAVALQRRTAGEIAGEHAAAIEVGHHAALRDGAVEQALRQRRGHQCGDRHAAGGLPEQGDVARVAAEAVDVGLHPLQRRQQVHQGVIAERSIGLFDRQLRMGEQAEAVEAVVRGHHDHAFAGKVHAAMA